MPYAFASSDREQAVRLPVSRTGNIFGRLRSTRVLLERPLLSTALLVTGCLVFVGLVSHLQGLGLGLASLGSLRTDAGGAISRVLSASAALAEADFATSERDFADAEQRLAEIQVDLDAALASSQTLARYVDVTGTIRSGEELLRAAEALASAGQYLSRGLASLLASDTVSLTAAVKAAQQEFAGAEEALAEAEKSLGKVESPLLPTDVEEQVRLLSDNVPRVRVALRSFLEQSDLLLTMLGEERGKQYLVLFQNNHELRPTGGFIGSLALIDVDQGMIENVVVQSVYEPDGQLKEFIAPPDPLLPVTGRWHLRDANWFVDWPVSAAKIADFYEKEGGPTVDGVIALTPEVIRSLLAVTGPIPLPTYGITVSAENFWEVTQDQVTYDYDKALNKPKQFLGDLTPILLQRLFASPPESALKVLSVIMNAVEEKHLLLYFRDAALEQQLKELRWAAAVPRGQQGFLAINNANIGGHKSDQFVEQDVDVRYDVRADGDVDVILTIRRTHHGPDEAGSYQYPPAENPSQKNNVVYQRVLVPAGAELVRASGFAPEADIPLYVVPEHQSNLVADPDVAQWQQGQVRHESGTVIGQEAGYTFFANWLVTRPGTSTVASYHYRLPRHAAWPSSLDPAERFEVYYFKQPGDMRTTLRITLRLPEAARIVHQVPREGVTQSSPREIVWQGAAVRDVLLGAVFEVE